MKFFRALAPLRRSVRRPVPRAVVQMRGMSSRAAQDVDASQPPKPEDILRPAKTKPSQPNLLQELPGYDMVLAAFELNRAVLMNAIS